MLKQFQFLVEQLTLIESIYDCKLQVFHEKMTLGLFIVVVFEILNSLLQSLLLPQRRNFGVSVHERHGSPLDVFVLLSAHNFQELLLVFGKHFVVLHQVQEFDEKADSKLHTFSSVGHHSNQHLGLVVRNQEKT